MNRERLYNLIRAVSRHGAIKLGCAVALDRSIFTLDVCDGQDARLAMAEKLLYELYRISVDSQSSAIDQWQCGHTICRYLLSIDKDLIIDAWKTGGSGTYPLVPGASLEDNIQVAIPEFIWDLAAESAVKYGLDQFLVKFSLRMASLNESDNLSDHVRRLYAAMLRIFAVSSAKRIESTKPYGPNSLTYVLGAITDDLASDVARYVAGRFAAAQPQT